MSTDAESRRILRERGARRGPPPPHHGREGAAPGAGDEKGQGDERDALLAAQVSDVQPLRELTPLPGTPDFLRGLVNIRGRLVPVIDLKRFFGLPEPGITDLHRVLLLQKDGIEIGLLADTVEGVATVPASAIQPPLPTLAGIHADYVHGITAERLVVLDADAILDDQRIIIDEEVA